MRISIHSLAVFIAATLATWVPQAAQAAPQLTVYTGAGCDGRAKLARFEKLVNRKVDGVMTGMSYSNLSDQLSTLRYGQKCWRGAPYRIILWVPMLVKDGNLEAGARGDYDQQFREIAAILMRNGRGDAYLRIGHEFNANWYPWRADKDPEAWKAYFRRIVKIFRETPGSNFTIVWNPGLGKLEIEPDKVYPGDDVVDVIGVDFYNRNIHSGDATPQGRWRRYLAQPYGLNWLVTFAHQHNKPIAVPEWGTGYSKDNGAGDDPDFVRYMAKWLNANNVLFHGYWDTTMGYDSLISTGRLPNSAAAFRKAFGPGAIHEGKQPSP